MKVIEGSTEIARTPGEVFDFISDASLLPEWQPAVIEAVAEAPAVRQVGMHGYEIRRLPGGPKKIRWQVTESEPGRRWAVEGLDGPVRAHVGISLRPSDRAGTYVDYRVWFEGHGIGRILRLIATRGERSELPKTLSRLKLRLEGARVVG